MAAAASMATMKAKEGRLTRISSAAAAANIKVKTIAQLNLEKNQHYAHTLPEQSKWLKNAVLKKRVVSAEVAWHPRRVVITRDKVFLTRDGSEEIIEDVDLVSIENLRLLDKKDQLKSEGLEILMSRKERLKQEVESQNAFMFITNEDEGHGSRRFVFSCTSAEQAADWVHGLRGFVKDALNEEKKKNQFRWVVLAIKKAYRSSLGQGIVSCVILANFATAIIGAQLVPDPGSHTSDVLEGFEICFTVFFAVELLINLTGSYYDRWWTDRWNMFDIFIVIVSILAVSLQDVKGISLLRMSRVFRIIKIFQSLKSLRNVINALTAAILPVGNAFGVLAVVTAIYAVVGVDIYGEEEPVTFGDFASAMFTMFQVITADGWATVIARPMFSTPESPRPSVVLFFTSYILIVGTFLLNVVVAVLLDEFITAVQAGRAERRKLDERKKNLTSALDPLLAALACAESTKDLVKQIQQVYQTLDRDDSGGLSFEEMRVGLTKLETEPVIHLAPEDWDQLTEGGLLDEHGLMTSSAFVMGMRRALSEYTSRKATFQITESDPGQVGLSVVLLMLKQILFAEQDHPGGVSVPPSPLALRGAPPLPLGSSSFNRRVPPPSDPDHDRDDWDRDHPDRGSSALTDKHPLPHGVRDILHADVRHETASPMVKPPPRLSGARHERNGTTRDFLMPEHTVGRGADLMPLPLLGERERRRKERGGGEWEEGRGAGEEGRGAGEGQAGGDAGAAASRVEERVEALRGRVEESVELLARFQGEVERQVEALQAHASARHLQVVSKVEGLVALLAQASSPPPRTLAPDAPRPSLLAPAHTRAAARGGEWEREDGEGERLGGASPSPSRRTPASNTQDSNRAPPGEESLLKLLYAKLHAIAQRMDELQTAPPPPEAEGRYAEPDLGYLLGQLSGKIDGLWHRVDALDKGQRRIDHAVQKTMETVKEAAYEMDARGRSADQKGEPRDDKADVRIGRKLDALHKLVLANHEEAEGNAETRLKQLLVRHEEAAAQGEAGQKAVEGKLAGLQAAQEGLQAAQEGLQAAQEELRATLSQVHHAAAKAAEEAVHAAAEQAAAAATAAAAADKRGGDKGGGGRGGEEFQSISGVPEAIPAPLSLLHQPPSLLHQSPSVLHPKRKPRGEAEGRGGSAPQRDPPPSPNKTPHPQRVSGLLASAASQVYAATRALRPRAREEEAAGGVGGVGGGLPYSLLSAGQKGYRSSTPSDKPPPLLVTAHLGFSPPPLPPAANPPSLPAAVSGGGGGGEGAEGAEAVRVSGLSAPSHPAPSDPSPRPRPPAPGPRNRPR